MIKRWYQFISEEISGTELVGPIGPAYGETRLQNKTVTSHHTNVIHSDINGKFYTEDEYNELHTEYLKAGGKPLSGFSKENIEQMLNFLEN